MKKYLWVSSIIAFVTLVVCCLIGFFSTDWKDIQKFTEPYQKNEEKLISSYNTDYQIELDMKNAQLEIMPAVDDKIKIVSQYNQEKNIFAIQATKEKLKIVKTDEVDDIEITFLNFSSESRGKVILYLPEKINSDIHISGNNGIVRVYDIHGEKLVSSVTNGAYDIFNVDFNKSVSLHSTNGAVSVSQLDTASIDIRTTNGLIECNQINADTVRIQSVNGIIESTDLYAKDISLLTKNGAIQLSNLKDPNYIIDTLRTHTKFGEVEIDAPVKNRIEK